MKNAVKINESVSYNGVWYHWRIDDGTFVISSYSVTANETYVFESNSKFEITSFTELGGIKDECNHDAAMKNAGFTTYEEVSK